MVQEKGVQAKVRECILALTGNKPIIRVHIGEKTTLCTVKSAVEIISKMEEEYGTSHTLLFDVHF